MDLTRYKGKTVEKWTALIPAASRGDVSSYGVLLVYKKKAVGAYLLEKPSGTVTGLKDAQTAMALQEAEQVSGEDFSGDWGERHEDELTDGQAQQTSGEDFSGDWGERHDGELGAEVRPSRLPASRTLHRSSPCSTPTCRWTPRATRRITVILHVKSAVKQNNCAVVVIFAEGFWFNVTQNFLIKNRQYERVEKRTTKVYNRGRHPAARRFECCVPRGRVSRPRGPDEVRRK